MKICVVSISLAKGGAERSTAILTEMLNELGHEVHLVLMNDQIDYDFKGKLLNLGINKTNKDSLWDRFGRMKRIRRYLKMHKIDYVIDNRTRISPVIEILYLKYIYRKLKVIYVVRSYNLSLYFTESNWVSNMIIKNVEHIVGVSKQISKTINLNFNTSKAIAIYNPIHLSVEDDDLEVLSERYILFLGRLDDKVKNFSLLIEGYRKSQLPKNSVQLKIVGDGDARILIQKMIRKFKLEDCIQINDFIPNVELLLKNALFLVLTSRYEGFPRVLIEALSVGTPVISVNCDSGPSEIINHKENGLLVENYDPQALAAAFDSFLLDKDLYNFCKSNSIASVAHLNKQIIAKQWSKILNDA